MPDEAANLASIDFETRSEVDLRRVGAQRYARDPSTDVLCLAYALPGDAQPDIWLTGDPPPARLLAHVANGGLLAGWNIAFERNIWLHVMRARHRWPAVPDEQWRCTMARAAYWGLPGALDAAAAALGLPYRKDQAGHSLMLRMCRPRSRDLQGRPTWWHETEPQRLTALAGYCIGDVLAERAVGQAVGPMPEREHAVWVLDQEMNETGVGVDLDLVARLREISERTKIDLNVRLSKITNRVVSSVSKIADLKLWLATAHQVLLPDMRRETLAGAVGDLTLPPPARAALQCRLDAGRASTAKLDALVESVNQDGLLRGLLRYYGAGRTGRWSGAGGSRVQLQNLPRGAIKHVQRAIDLVLAGAGAVELELFHGTDALTVVAACLRGAFTAPHGEQLVAADESQIEARVLAWLAGQQDVLNVFASGQDIYTHTAEGVGSNNRQFGKIVVLGLGFGMGWRKFQAVATAAGIVLDETQARGVVKRWRSLNRHVVQFWYDLDHAFRKLINAHPGARYRVGQHIELWRGRAGIGMQLPVGRALFYRNPRIDPEQDCILYDGVDQRTKRWGPIRAWGGKLAEHATQAVARDVLAETLLALRGSNGLRLLLTVHDEIIASAWPDTAEAALAHLLGLLRKTPVWAPGLPVAAEGWTGPRLRK